MRILLLRDDRTYEYKARVNQGGEAFLGPNKGLYVMDPTAIQPYTQAGQVEGSEIIFFESNSSPVPVKPPKPGKKGEINDPSTTYLDNFIYKNALEQTGDPQVLSLLTGIMGLVRPLLEPANFIKMILVLLIAQAIIRGALGA